MKLRVLFFCVVVLCANGFAQKIKVGHKKGIDFRQYKTFTVAPTGMPTDYPILLEIVQGAIQQEFATRGLKQVDKGGDLILVASGALVWQVNQQLTSPYLPLPGLDDLVFDPSMWVGSDVDWIVEGSYFQQGTLALQFVDPKKKEVVWIGTVKQSIDLQNDTKEKSMDLVNKAVTKLIDEYPPKD